MIEPTQAQVDAALKIFASPWAENWEPLVMMAVRAALNVDADDPVIIDGAGWAEAAFDEFPNVTFRWVQGEGVTINQFKTYA